MLHMYGETVGIVAEKHAVEGNKIAGPYMTIFIMSRPKL